MLHTAAAAAIYLWHELREWLGKALKGVNARVELGSVHARGQSFDRWGECALSQLALLTRELL